MEKNKKTTPKSFLFNVLNGVALAIVVGLIPNAILGSLFNYLSQSNYIFTKLLFVVQGIQFTIPVITGVLIALQFKLSPIQAVITGTAAFIGSGSAIISEEQWVLTGIGDLINTMITSSISILIILIVKDRLGSLNIILLPLIAGALPGLLGLLMLPCTQLITTGLGNIVNSVTNTQPMIMSIIISVLFSVIIISPVSTVAISMAIGISGLAAGSAAIGVTSSAIMLVVGTWKVNKIGVPIAILLGAMKMMMPNMIRYPILLLPVTCNAAISGFFGSLLQIKNDAESAGFGLVGLIGPIKSMNFLEGSSLYNLSAVIAAYIIIPFISALIVNLLFSKILNMYNSKIFIFKTNDTMNKK
ncbi:PTS transporter subunit IIC [Staphylococcus gallinarum]|uniref:PTS transporter subunit IIC n=1 Tax=Staphylococcus gallinarum TaxID=1293 RepID=UPI00317F0211